MAVSNLKVNDPSGHAKRLTKFAFSVIDAAKGIAVHPQRPELGMVNIRVGLHAGEGSEEGCPKSEEGGTKSGEGGRKSEEGGPKSEEGGTKSKEGGPK